MKELNANFHPLRTDQENFDADNDDVNDSDESHMLLLLLLLLLSFRHLNKILSLFSDEIFPDKVSETCYVIIKKKCSFDIP